MRFLLSSLAAVTFLSISVDARQGVASPCPVRCHVLIDGGSVLFEIPAHGDFPAISIYKDGRGDSKTQGAYFTGDGFQRGRWMLMEAREVLQVFERIETILIEKYGAKELFLISMRPLIVGGNVPAEEYTEYLTKKPDCVAEIEVSELLAEIQTYRSTHRLNPQGELIIDEPSE